jgi:hypothetical protein
MAVAVHKRDDLGAVYLQQMQALASEITSAMEAIAGNALPRLEESVARQEMICASLKQMAGAVQQSLQTPQRALPEQMDEAVAAKIRAANGALQTLNLQYAALLKHSGRSIALLSSLCRTHTGQSQEARGARLKHQTWSCEA